MHTSSQTFSAYNIGLERANLTRCIHLRFPAVLVMFLDLRRHRTPAIAQPKTTAHMDGMCCGAKSCLLGYK
jgi:hypothetical protein